MLRPGEGTAGIAWGGDAVSSSFSFVLCVPAGRRHIHRLCCASAREPSSFADVVGLFSLFVVISGFAQLGIMGAGFPGWAIVKLLCWLVLSVVAGIVFRKPNQIKAWLVVSLVAILVAVGMVTFKPF